MRQRTMEYVFFLIFYTRWLRLSIMRGVALPEYNFEQRLPPYTNIEQGMHKIKHQWLLGLYLPRITCTIVHFLLLVRSWSIFIHACNRTEAEFISIKQTRVFRWIRVRLFDQNQSSSAHSHLPNEPDFQGKQTRVRFKWTKRGWCECTLG